MTTPHPLHGCFVTRRRGGPSEQYGPQKRVFIAFPFFSSVFI
jgi:hypothetical protein